MIYYAPIKHSAGYTMLWSPAHPRAYHGRVYEHIVIAERALRRSLPLKAKVHHVNGVESDNATSNLVICENQAYHLLLHRRSRALKAAGSPDAVKCVYCKQWGFDGINGMHRVVRSNVKSSSHSYHRGCQTYEAITARGDTPFKLIAKGKRIK